MSGRGPVADLVDAHRIVRDRIARACRRAGRDPSSVTLVAVSKTVPPERLRDAIDAGLDTLGENRVQEAVAKAPLVPGASWHLVGPLQSNKARRAVETFAMIQSVDSVELAQRLDRLAQPGYPILLQVNVDRDPGKAGFDAREIEDAAERLDGLSLDVRGLMTVGRQVGSASDARPTFIALRRVADVLRARWPRLGPELSMGMSDDFEVAVEEGATIVRVGRALFGERPHDERGEEARPDPRTAPTRARPTSG